MTRPHPALMTLAQAMTDQPDLTMFGTNFPDQQIEMFGQERLIQLPIAENAMLNMATGLALTGKRALVNIARAAFLYTAMDPLVNQATRWRYFTGGQFSVPLLVMGYTMDDHEHLGAQHEHMNHSMLAQLPGLVVVVPSSPNTAAGLLATALNHPDPVVYLGPPAIFAPGWDELPEPEPSTEPIPFGVAKRLTTGEDVTLVGIGNTVLKCLRAAEILAEQGVRCQAVDLRTAAPLDRTGVAAFAATTAATVLVDETPPQSSLMNELALHLLTTQSVAAERLKVLTAPASPLPISPPLRARLIPDANAVVAAAQSVLPALVHNAPRHAR